MQHEVALGAGPVSAVLLPHRLELERQVVAERPVKPEVRVRPGEGGDDLAQRGEHGWPAAALLLGEDLIGVGDQHLDVARVCAGAGACGRGWRPWLAAP